MAKRSFYRDTKAKLGETELQSSPYLILQLSCHNHVPAILYDFKIIQQLATLRCQSFLYEIIQYGYL